MAGGTWPHNKVAPVTRYCSQSLGLTLVTLSNLVAWSSEQLYVCCSGVVAFRIIAKLWSGKKDLRQKVCV